MIDWIPESTELEIRRLLKTGMTGRKIAKATGVSHWTVNRVRQFDSLRPRPEKEPPLPPPDIKSLVTSIWCVGKTGGNIVTSTTQTGYVAGSTVIEADTAGNDYYTWPDLSDRTVRTRAKLISQSPRLLLLALDILGLEYTGLITHPLITSLALNAKDILEKVSEHHDK